MACGLQLSVDWKYLRKKAGFNRPVACGLQPGIAGTLIQTKRFNRPVACGLQPEAATTVVQNKKLFQPPRGVWVATGRIAVIASDEQFQPPRGVWVATVFVDIWRTSPILCFNRPVACGLQHEHLRS